MRMLTTVTALALTLTACTDGDTGTTPDPGQPETTATTTSSTAAPTTTAIPSASTTLPPMVGEPQTETFASTGYPRAGAPSYLTELRVESYEPFARVVFEFQGDAPEYKLEYVDGPVVASPSGNPVEVQGEGFLVLSLTPASGVDLSGDAPEMTYTGPDRVEIDAPPLHELLKTEDFESHMTWVIGVEDELPFSFSTLQDPPRIVVDVHLPDETASADDRGV